MFEAKEGMKLVRLLMYNGARLETCGLVRYVSNFQEFLQTVIIMEPGATRTQGHNRQRQTAQENNALRQVQWWGEAGVNKPESGAKAVRGEPRAGT